MSTKKTDLGGKNPQWKPRSHATKRLLLQDEVDI